MSGGRSARFGFLFSDLLILKRVLQHRLQARVAQVEGGPLPSPPIFLVESAATPGQAPDWDIQEQHPGVPPRFIIEEVKSGPLGAADRKTFWSRIRRTVARLDNLSAVQVVPRLTINRDNPTDHQDRWLELPQLVAEVSGMESPHAFTSSRALAEEALYWLTHNADDREGEDATLLLPLDRAREVLSAFQLNNTEGADTLEQEVVQLVGHLSLRLGAEEICSTLLGALYRRASSPAPERRQFTAEEFWSASSVLQHLSDASPDDITLWQAWQQRAITPAQTGEEALTTSGLPYQNWRDVQPSIATALAPSHHPFIALIGRGGLGKSFILSKLHQEMTSAGDKTLWLSGAELRREPEQVRRTLNLGAFMTSLKGHPLRVFIDGFENAADHYSGLKSLLVSLSSIDHESVVSVFLTVRHNTWGGLSGTQEEVAPWRALNLSDWDEDRVRSLVYASQRPSIGPELIRLLRTPLFLDLFLRTFGTVDHVPSGLRTRHEVLRAYWMRRIFPSDKPEDSVARANALLQCCTTEAEGQSWHLVTEPAMHQLASEGVFLHEQGGYVFRHPLLRDFAMMHWATRSGRDADGTIRKVAAISSSLTRWGTLRALFEAANSTSRDAPQVPTLETLLNGVQLQGETLLLLAAEVLGELEDPTEIEMHRLIGTLHSSEQAAAFIDRVLDLAKQSSNAGWLTWLATLPMDLDWPDKTNWVHEDFITRASDLLEVVWRLSSTRSNPTLALAAKNTALRLRHWSSAAKFTAKLAGSEGFHWRQLMLLVGEQEPSQVTLGWMSDHASYSWRTRRAALETLPLLVARAKTTGNSLSNAVLVTLFQQAAGLRRDAFGLRKDPKTSSAIDSHVRTEVALLGHGAKSHRGLLHEAPEVFLAVAFDMLSGLAKDEHIQEEPLWAKIKQELANSLRSNDTTPDTKESPSILEIRSQIQAITGPLLSPNDAMGPLIDDTDGEQYENTSFERAFILNALTNSVRDDIDTEGKFVEQLYWPNAKASRSAVSWVLLLDCLSENDTGPQAILDEILSSRPLYHIYSAHHYLHRALVLRWPRLDNLKRKVILEHIASVGRSPTMNGMYGVAKLASAIPAADRPDSLELYLELYRRHGWNPTPQKTLTTEVFYRGALPVPATGNSSRLPSNWRAVSGFRLGEIAPRNSAAFSSFLSDLRTALASGIPAPVDAAQEPQLLQSLHDFFGGLYGLLGGSQTGLTELQLTSEEVRQLVRWGFDVASQCSTSDLSANPQPVRVRHAPESGAFHPWVVAIEFLSVALLHPTIREDLSLNSQLLDEVSNRLLPPPEFPPESAASEESYHTSYIAVWVKQVASGLSRFLPSLWKFFTRNARTKALPASQAPSPVTSPSLAWYTFRAVNSHHFALDKEKGGKLLKRLISERVRDPGALTMAFHHIWCLDTEERSEVLRLWLTHEYVLSISSELEEFASEIGSFLGAAALVSKEGAPNDVRRLSYDFLATPPRTGLLAHTGNYLHWAIGLAFGAKEHLIADLANADDESCHEYVSFVDAIWSRVRSQWRDNRDSTFMLFVLNPLDAAIDSGSPRGRKVAQRLWSYLEPLVRRIVNEGEASDLFHVFFYFRDDKTVHALGAQKLLGLVEALHTRAFHEGERIHEPSRTHGDGWQETLEYGADMIGAVARSPDATPDVKTRLHTILQEWARVLRVRNATQVARSVRHSIV